MEINKKVEPVVTVLMPVYNAAKYLPAAIESILGQSMKNFEFLIIDDGSSDNSVEIIQSYNDARIRMIRNEQNLGITRTLNKGIELASCELIARMDADDISYPQRLAKQYQFFQENDDCVLLSNAVRLIYTNRDKTKAITFDSDFVYYELIYTCKIYHPVVMYRKSVLLKEGGYINEFAEDFNLWWRLTRKYRFHHDNEILLDYRYSESSLSKVTKKNEYDNAEFQQIVSNINSYTGGKVAFNYDEVDFLRKDLKPLLEKNGTGFIINCFKKFDQMNRFVLDKEMAGPHGKSITGAIAEKKRERFRNLRRYLSRKQIFMILIHLKYWSLLGEFVGKPIYKRLTVRA